MANPLVTNIWHQVWKDGHNFELAKEMVDIWNQYISALLASHIRILKHEDELVWDYDQASIYTPKVGYIHLSVDDFARDQKWWWR